MVVLRAALALGKGLGIPVLTEGVETLNQLDMLKLEGCDQAQGYLLGRPCPLSLLVANGIVSAGPSAIWVDARHVRALPNVA